HGPAGHLAVALAVTMLLSLAHMPAKASTRAIENVKIGVLLPLSGPSAEAGKQARCALELATEAINASGGIASLGGAKLINVWADTAGDPAVGMTATNRLIKEEKVRVVSGAWNSAVTYPTTQAAQESRIPYVVPVAVRDAITERGFRYVFRLAPKDSWRARDQFRFLAETARSTGAKITSVALVFEKGPWGSAMRDMWTKTAQAKGYRVALEEPYDPASPDLTATVMKTRNASADAILLASFTADAVLLARTMNDLGVKAGAVVASGAGHASPDFARSAGGACEYIFDISAWEPDMNRPDIPRFTEEFARRCGSAATPEAAFSYVSVFVVARALGEAGSADPEDIRDALADIKLCRDSKMKGFDILPQGCIEFDRSGQNSSATHVVVQYRKVGTEIQRVTVWPQSAARPGFRPVFPMP
ncbi:MAG TPA: ABC transporter substrate-binding protein, partial [Deltaproteobacteria bacterium]|nr:ABC transporter substrate-binding protein [Deltaproteobacteria bacterium]